jgi:hypothetical protein
MLGLDGRRWAGGSAVLGKHGKKMYLMLDNAGYHHHRGPEWIYPSKLKKSQLAEVLRQCNVPSIAINDDTKHINADKFSADANRGGPTVKDLQAAVKKLLRDNHTINTTVPQQLMSDKNHILVYTPPFVPEVQPMEMIWGQVKNEVARQSTLKRTTVQTREQTETAFEHITSSVIIKRIDHCHKWIDEFLQSDEGGSLKQFGTLQSIIDHPVEVAAIRDSAPITLAEEE